jgi:RNA polymerase-binding protein DksA
MTLALKTNHYQDKLLALREHLDASISPSAMDAIDLADWADRANQQTEVAVNIGLVAHEAAMRKEIDDALERITADTFGICEKCQAVIGARRLNALPYARYCVRCERRIELEGKL